MNSLFLSLLLAWELWEFQIETFFDNLWAKWESMESLSNHSNIGGNSTPKKLSVDFDKVGLYSLFRKKNPLKEEGDLLNKPKTRERRNTHSQNASNEFFQGKTQAFITPKPKIFYPQISSYGAGILGELEEKLFLLILQLLGPKELCYLGMTCKYFHQKIDSFDLLWKKLLDSFHRPESLIMPIKQQNQYPWKELYIQHGIIIDLK